MGIPELVNKYFEQIEVENTDFVPVDNAVSDAAYLLLVLPIKMLKEYQKFKGSRKKLPDGAKFWKETGLARRLRDSKKYPRAVDAPLNDILDYLGGDVWGNYQELDNPSKIRLSITEIPEFYKE